MAPRKDIKPTDLQTLTMFKFVAQEYFSLAAAMPIDDSSLESSPGFTIASDRWQQLIRAFALRKFFLLPRGDHVYCENVYRAYLNSVSEPDDADMTPEEYATSVVGLVRLDLDLPDGGVAVQNAVENLLHGVFLHSNFLRLKRIEEFRGSFNEDMALRLWVEPADKHLNWLFHVILTAESRGRLPRLPELPE